MATVFTHTVVALAAGRVCFGRTMPARFWVLAPVCSMLPDADVVLFNFGVEYGDLWGHRGLTHSLLFALVLAVAVVSLAFRRDAPWLSGRWWMLTTFFFVLTASHGVIDALTDGGLGIAFFSPFDQTRYFLPVQPIEVSPIGLRGFFSPWGLNVIVSEMLWVWVPALVIAAIAWAFRRSRRAA